MESTADELIQDAEEADDVPIDTPEAEGEDPLEELDANGRMPGQLPIGAHKRIFSFLALAIIPAWVTDGINKFQGVKNLNPMTDYEYEKKL